MPSTTHTGSILKLPPLPAFSIVVAISLAIWWTPLTTSFSLALSDDQYTHLLLIMPISAALVWIDWKSDRKSEWRSPEPSVGLSAVVAVVFLIVALCVNAAARRRMLPSSDIQLATSMLALVVFWIAAFGLCFGTRALRRELFPLCFLLWLVPLPLFMVESVVSLLQKGSADTAHLFFAAVGIPVAQRGVLVHIPGLTLDVAPECSSIRSSLVLMVATMFLAHLLLRSGWKKAVVIAAAIPLSVAKNGLRIFILGVLATRVDPSFLTGKLHRDGGILFFLIALLAIFVLLWILRRGEGKEPTREARTSV